MAREIKLVETTAPKGLVRAHRGALLYTKGAFKGDFRGWAETRYFVNKVADIQAALGSEWRVESY